jgi:hypothetical protein
MEKSMTIKPYPENKRVGVTMKYCEGDESPPPEISSVEVLIWYSEEQLLNKTIPEIEQIATKDIAALLPDIIS